MATGATIFGIAYILVLVIPGVLFKTFYYKGKFAKQIASGLFADRILTTLFWGIAMQVISLLLFCLSFGISLGQFLDKATQYLNYLTSGRFPPISENDFMLIMQYVGMVVVFSIVIGLLSHWTIRTFKLDVKFENFKLTDHWYYLFSGEITEKISKRPTNGYKVVQTLVDVLVKENNGDCNLYTGLWAHHISTVKGELDTLYLIDVKKAKIQEDPEAVQAAGAEQPESTSKWEEVSGDFFIIPYSNVLNLNVRYVYINTRKK